MNRTQDQPLQGAVGQAVPVAYADSVTRLAFLRKVYALFGGTMAVWAGCTFLVMSSSSTLEWMFGVMGGGFLTFMLVFAGLFLLLRMTANSFPLNLIGLGVFGVFEGFMTAPLVYLAMLSTSGSEQAMALMQAGQVDLSLVTQGAGIVAQAFGLTVATFGGLTAYALTTKKDFSWLGGALWMGFAVLFGIIVLSFFGVGEGLVMGWGFSLAWVILMAGFVLYDTQKILKTYPENAAATAAAVLFIDFVIMFKYMLMLLMRRD
jgi:FtsH-binding integral membrane protein